jgi:hypothetical protein
MTILDRLLDELHSVKAPIKSSDLATRIGVSQSALDGMIEVLVGKGKLVGSPDLADDDLIACSGTACGVLCVGLDQCPFIVDVPEMFSLVIESPPLSRSSTSPPVS